jgi:hypothetical protein
MAANLEIESITIPLKKGYRNKKNEMEKEHREKMIETAILLSTLATLVVISALVFGVVMLAMR